jgi:hypothetical protein
MGRREEPSQVGSFGGPEAQAARSNVVNIRETNCMVILPNKARRAFKMPKDEE